MVCKIAEIDRYAADWFVLAYPQAKASGSYLFSALCA